MIEETEPTMSKMTLKQSTIDCLGFGPIKEDKNFHFPIISDP